MVSFFFVQVSNIVNIRLGSFWTERTKSGVTTQHVVEVAEKQNCMNVVFFRLFFFFHLKLWLKQMEQMLAQERQNASNFIGVFMQFCLLSA